MQPPSLRAIVPWDGFTDAYRDLVRPGGIAEVGFVSVWSRGVGRARLRYSIGAESKQRPMRDEWWQSLVPDLGRITVPALGAGTGQSAGVRLEVQESRGVIADVRNGQPGHCHRRGGRRCT